MRAALLLLVATPAFADDQMGVPLPKRPAADVNAGLEYTRFGDSLGGVDATMALAQHAAILPKERITMSMQDAALGVTRDKNVMYQFDFLFGVGHWFGPGGLGLVGGAGVDGITGHHIPFGVRLPLRAWAGANLGPALRIEASGEVAYITLTPDRRGKDLEWVGRTGLYILGRGREPGVFVGFTARKAMDTTMLTFGLGVGLAAAAVD